MGKTRLRERAAEQPQPRLLDVQMSSVASTMFYAIWSMFAGFLIMKPAIPGWWIWYYYLCPGARRVPFNTISCMLQDNVVMWTLGEGRCHCVVMTSCVHHVSATLQLLPHHRRPVCAMASPQVDRNACP